MRDPARQGESPQPFEAWLPNAPEMTCVGMRKKKAAANKVKIRMGTLFTRSALSPFRRRGRITFSTTDSPLFIQITCTEFQLCGMPCARPRGHECHFHPKEFPMPLLLFPGIFDPIISVASLEPLVAWVTERAAREILGLQQGCQGPEKHVVLSKSAAGRRISWDDEQA